MNQQGRWKLFPAGYRSAEVKQILQWIERGVSGSVIGLRGAGGSTLLDFIWNRPDIWLTYLPPTVKMSCITIDFNLMPDESLATLYRIMLRAFYQARSQFSPLFQQYITTKYEANLNIQDPFPPQSALFDLLDECQASQIKVACLLNRLDLVTDAQIGRTLRAFRDRYKRTLCYVVGSVQEMTNRADFDDIGKLYEVLDANICWVSSLSFDDTQGMIERKLQNLPDEETVNHIWQLTGGYPALVQAVCNWWWEGTRPGLAEWVTTLAQHKETQTRLRRIWNGLNQEEQLVLSELQKYETRQASKQTKKHLHSLVDKHSSTMQSLAKKGVCQQSAEGWAVFCALFSEFIAQVESRGLGRLWVDEDTNRIYQGKTLLELGDLGEKLLRFLVQNPYIRHTHDNIIENVWEETAQLDGVSNQSLQQHIRRVRQAIEPNPGKPVYVLTWHGHGYYCIPEGQTE